ncbi:MAG TPA: FecR domain-containing protein [Pyrinomonadaceae bacterium]|nr:FecR domain-containing protein [Pyrinomonadaceae bacterium]
MFGQQHVKEQLTAYAHGELPAAERTRVAAHLGACARCRAKFEEIAYGIRLVENLTPHAAPAALWDNIEAALAQQSFKENQAERAGQDASRETQKRRGWLPGGLSFGRFYGWQTALAAGLVLLLVLGAGGAFWFSQRSPRAGWDVARLQGAPSIDADRIGSTGRLGIGEWLETDADSRAQIKVADIGQVEVDPGTRIRLVETRPTEHRLELARGRMHAAIYAPPRLFFVDTPSAVAADLGCAYTLEVDDAGQSILHVTAGWVAFETKDRESMVPAGAACRTRPGVGPGTPFFEDASELFLDALAKFDFTNGGTDALSVVIAEARPRDTLTLWHLLARVEGVERERVYERLAALAPPPAGVTREGIMLLDPAMLYEWKAQMETTWLE